MRVSPAPPPASAALTVTSKLSCDSASAADVSVTRQCPVAGLEKVPKMPPVCFTTAPLTPLMIAAPSRPAPAGHGPKLIVSISWCACPLGWWGLGPVEGEHAPGVACGFVRVGQRNVEVRRIERDGRRVETAEDVLDRRAALHRQLHVPARVDGFFGAHDRSVGRRCGEAQDDARRRSVKE